MPIDPSTPPTMAELARTAAVAPPGLVCRKCGCKDFRVRNTRSGANVIRRYRICRHCGTVRTTTEK